MKLPFDPKSLADKAKANLPEITLPTLGREVDIPVYVIHNSIDPEDYFFIFDFEVFVERSKEGMFVRPKLKVWAGRDDFDRVIFARHFRQTFADEFDQMRAKLAKKKSQMGWLSWNVGADLVGLVVSNLTAYFVMLVAVGAGKALGNLIPLPSWMKGKSREAKLESQVDALKAQVEAALTRIDVTLHRELYLHSYRGTRGGPTTGMDYDAWPLPAHVVEHLTDKKSGSWW
jgi:hypothetical protein